MINAVDNTNQPPQAVYTKTKPDMVDSNPPGNDQKSKPTKKKSGMFKKLTVAAGLFTFLGLIAAGGFFVLRFQNTDDTIAPTRPQAASCTAEFTVPEPPNEFSCIKTAWVNEFGNEESLAQDNTYQYVTRHADAGPYGPGDIMVFRVFVDNDTRQEIDITLTDILSGDDFDGSTFLDSTCGANAYNAQTETLTCQLTGIAGGERQEIGFRVQLPEEITEDYSILNSVTIADQNQTDASCRVRVQIAQEPPSEVTYQCDSACETDAQCQTANPDYICDEAAGNRCRLEEYPASTTCEPPVDDIVYDCNSNCSTNAQCQTENSDYICYEGQCRLDENPSSESCELPEEEITYECNSDCTTDSQCQQANSDYICYDGECRLDENPTSQSCDLPENYECNDLCQTDEQCQTINGAHFCDPDAGNRCRLAGYNTSPTCTPPQDVYTCNSSCTTNTQCQGIADNFICYNGNCRMEENPTASNCQLPNPPQPSPILGCNDRCDSNADCANVNHICVTTPDGTNRCRLDEYPNSQYCTVPPVTRPGTIVNEVVEEYPIADQPQTPTQPVQPDALPVAGGFDDTVKAIAAGVGAVIVGALAVLLIL